MHTPSSTDTTGPGPSREVIVKPISGWLGLTITIIIILFALGGLIAGILMVRGQSPPHAPTVTLMVVSVVALVVGFVLSKGLVALPPNTALVMLLLGEYKGTVREPGFYLTNPFITRQFISLRVRNQVTETVKVNDQRGSPIEIGAVVVWRVVDSFAACFEVYDYSHFVSVQSESAVRHLASHYPYDATEPGTLSLQGSTEAVNHTLTTELTQRLARAGIRVEETRLSHLAYAPEIAGAMLRRQQAEAVVAARTRIVEGAVGMVEMALDHLSKNREITLDPERKAAMVGNLMVVLCGDQAVQPVVNTGTAHH